jgi:hypothetical protein
MESLSLISAFCRLCKESQKWGLFISIYEPEGGPYEAQSAAPYLDDGEDEHLQIITDGVGFFLFDTKEDMNIHYRATIGDDGPTELNSYNGETRIYALTCDPFGQALNENT